jgi:protein TonB
MLDLPRALRHSAVGLVVFALGCTRNEPPAETPLETARESAATPEPLAEPAAAPEPTSPGPAAPEPTSPGTTAPEAPAAPHAPRDARGKEQIQQVMAANRDKVRTCYDAALAQNPGIHGDLVVDFVIDPRGHVKQADVNWSASEIHVPELDRCAADAVRSLVFPPSSRGLESKVSYPFNFNPPRTDPPPKTP